MPNFEQPPVPPPEPEKEQPRSSESKEGEAQGVIRRLGRHVSEWRTVYVSAFVTSQILNVMVDLVKKERREREQAAAAAQKRLEAEPSLEIDIRFDELRALDPEASPERIRFILDTLPEGFVEDEIASMGFVNEVLPQRTDYYDHPDTNKGDAGSASGGTRAEKTVVTFWRGAQTSGSEWIWGEAMVHEIAHANDWDNDRQLNALERADLKAKVIARVLSDDRYKSDYVESIKNPDKQLELENKVKEYWAEIVEAYLNGKLDPSSPDGALVAAHIAKNDPTFDRDEALARRNGVIGEMSAEEKVAEYASLPQAERESVESWLAWRTKLEMGGADPERQREGRRELVEAFKRWGATPQGEKYLYHLVSEYFSYEGLYDARLSGDAGLEDANLWMIGERIDDLEGAYADFPDAEAARAEIEGIMRSNGVWIGGSKTGMELQPGEYDRLKPEITSKSQEYMFNSWHRPDHENLSDPVREYLDRKVFTMPE